MLQKRRKPLFLLTAIALVLCMAFDTWTGNSYSAYTGKGYSGTEQTIIKVLDGSAGQLKPDSVLLIEDAKFFDPVIRAKMNTPYKVENMVSFEVNDDALLMIQSDFKAKVQLQIKTTAVNEQVTTSIIDLELDYKKDKATVQRKTYLFKDAYRVEVKVISVDKGAATWDVFSVLKVVSQMQSFPDFKFHCSDNAVKSIAIKGATPPANTTLDELSVNWTDIVEADEYDLEWAYIDSAALASGRYGNINNPDPKQLFSNNASRVSVTRTTYNIPLFYDKKGHLFFRVRSVHWSSNLSPEGGRIEADWSSDYTASGGLGRFDFDGHEQKINWQSSTTFAEEGKRKSVVQYFDGTLRSRQTVTKDNVSNSAIATESLYDYQGRPVIQVMPAPTLNNVIGYTRGLNRAPGKVDYDKSLYDTLPDPNQYCGIQGMPMDTSAYGVMSASRYYSPANDSIAIPKRESRAADPRFALTPDAEQYPFTEVEYEQDNSGRIKRQSGVGKTFRMGGGRETQYAYGTPDQKELDALFGTEAGNASHYQKNIVRDANGQFSISYTDMHGRTVATALAGTPSSDIKQDVLSSAQLETRVRSLSDPSSAILSDLVMASRKSFEVTRDRAVHTFQYALNPQSLELEGFRNNVLTNFCYDCLYDLQITITSDCNNGKMPKGVAFDTLIRNFSAASIDTTCTPAQPFSVGFSLMLNKGIYEVTKKLTVSQSSLDYYRDSLFMKRNRYRDFQSFIEEARALVNLGTFCKPECAGCLDSLGSWDNFWTKYKLDNNIAVSNEPVHIDKAKKMYDDLRNACVELCDPGADSLSIRAAMMADLTPPFGQYADTTTDTHQYSIFNSANASNYRTITNYKNEKGEPAMVYWPASGRSVPPQSLGEIEFIDNFQASWANALLPLHPEYCKLQQYDQLNLSHQWDRRMEKTETYAEALQKGYLNPTNSAAAPFNAYAGTAPLDSDPLATLIGGYFKSRLENGMNQFRNTNYSLYSIAAISIICTGQTAAPCVALYGNATELATSSLLCEADRNNIWNAFKVMYLQMKRQLILDWLSTQCPTPVDPGDPRYIVHFAPINKLLENEGLPLPNDAASAETERVKAAQKMQEYYESNCKSYVEYWIKTLAATCAGYDTADLRRTVIPKLLEVCKAGADQNHPYGSSSIAPSSTYGYKSFEDVLREYNQQKGIKSNDCNAYSIEVPRPYNQQLPNSRKPVIGKPSDCECELINKYNNEYLNKGRYKSFGEYMRVQYASNIDDTSANYLVAVCNNKTITCELKQEMVTLPTAFQCNTGEICIDCDQFGKYDAEFKTMYPDVLPSSDPNLTDSVQLSWNKLYERFLNYRTGYTKTTTEYLAFGAKCGVTSGNYNCDSLNRIFANFIRQRRNDYAVSYFMTTDKENEKLTDPYLMVRDGMLVFPDSIQQRSTLPLQHSFIAKPNNEKKFCAGNGFSVEVRARFTQAPSWEGEIMSMALAPATGSGAGFGLARYKAGPLNGLYLERVNGFGENVVYGSGSGGTGQGFTRVLISADTNIIYNWFTLKEKVTPSAYEIYFNDALVITLPRNNSLPFPDVYQFGLNTFSRHGNVDWFRYYDNNDPEYFEDFNDLSGYSLTKDGAICPPAATDCKAAFTDFFNQARGGTVLTYVQIEQLYRKTCGKVPNICGVVDSLENLRNRFNSRQSPNRTKVKLVSGTPTSPDRQITEPREMIRGGAWQWPASSQSPTATNKNYFTIDTENGTELCTGQGFSVEARMKFLSNPFGSANADVFSFNAPGNLIANITQRANTGGGTGIYLSEIWSRDASGVLTNQPITPVQLFANHTDFYNNWQSFRFQIDIDSIRVFSNAEKKLAIVNPFHTLINSSSVSFEVNSYLAVFDRVKVKNSGSIIMLDEDFNDSTIIKDFDGRFICTTAIPCQTAFVNYFNQQRGTSYNFRQIDSLYNSITGRSLDVCGARDSLVNLLQSFGRDGRPLKISFSTDMSNSSLNHYNGTNQENCIEDGVLRWPDHVRDQQKFDLGWRYFNISAPTRFCGGNGYTIEGQIRAFKDNLRTTEENVYVSVGSGFTIVLYKSTYPNPLNQPLHGFNVSRILVRNSAGSEVIDYDILQNKDYNISRDPAFFSSQWHTFKIKVSGNKIVLYWNEKFVCEGTSPSGVFIPRDFATISVGFMGNQSAIDWLKLYNEKDELMMQENFDNRIERTQVNPAMLCQPPAQACQTAFVNYYNLKKGTQYSFARIDSIYTAMTGVKLNVCDFTQQKEMLCGRSISAYPMIPEEEVNSCSDSTFFIQSKAQVRYANYIDSLRSTFDSLYKAKCLDAYKYETFTVRDTASEYHYTLYYYDLAGNLVKTVPPAGVRPNRDPAWLNEVALARKNKTMKVPQHLLPTNYRYNGLNQVIAQKSPDGGTSKFWYDRLGRLVISQNARQQYASSTEEDRLYSYTKYDSLGRITEVGQLKNTAANQAMTDSISHNPALLANWLQALDQRREQITTTVYDNLYAGFIGAPGNEPPLIQRNLRNRVSYTTITDGWNTANYNQGTFYTYDIHGNVDTLLQDYGCGTCGLTAIQNLMNQNGNRFKKISYNYDLISGKVNAVAYQQGLSDQFFHRYSYDGENRLTLVETSHDRFNWEKDARYTYYLHGPLARTVLGTNQVQGIDYAYTLQGWLKGINSTGATETFDIGGDGNAGSDNRYVARDAYGFALNYFAEDYKPIDSRVNPFPNYSARLNADYRPLYNGNISSMVSTNRMFENPVIYKDSATLFFNYTYDQLNRITGMDVYNKFNRKQNNFDNLNKIEYEKYKERVSYDPNGNILKYWRNGNKEDAETVKMDILNYTYMPGKNRLLRVTDSVPASRYGTGNDRIIDIDDQPDSDNYKYDSIGNLIQDKAENINNINWNVYGKITGISRGEGPKVKASEIYYTYDAAGNRISKVIERDGRRSITWYVRDAQGNVMATYSGDSTIATPLKDFAVISTERYIYGSSRLGVDATSLPVDFGNAGPASRLAETESAGFRGDRTYELGNHLGNVLVTISDRKKGIADPLNAALIKFFEPVMLSGTDYYPFGMPMRIGGDSSYRYGFNGKENDNEVKGGDGLQQDYGMRVYDSRLGKFLSVDPVTQAYPWLTPYQFASNIPTRFVDLDGAESDDPLDQAQKGTTLLKIWTDTKDAAWNILFTTAYPHSQGFLIKKLLDKQGYDVGNIDVVQLSQAFDVISEEGQFKVISERSFTEKLFTLTFSSIAVAGALPSKGGGPYMAIKVSPIVSTAISDILKGLKLSQEIKQGIEEIEKFADRNHAGFTLKTFEAESGAILQANHGIKLREIAESGEKGDYAVVSGSINGKDLTGKTIDQMGIPNYAMKHFKMKDFLKSVDEHLSPKKGVDFILLDGRNLTEAQRGQVMDHLNKNHSKELERVITVGF